MLINICLGAANSFYVFLTMENFLTAEFKDFYEKWKVDSVAAEKEAKNDEDAMEKIEIFTNFWTKFGPLILGGWLAFILLLCSFIYCCLRVFKKSIRKYEDSHLNPAN